MTRVPRWVYSALVAVLGGVIVLMIVMLPRFVPEWGALGQLEPVSFAQNVWGFARYCRPFAQDAWRYPLHILGQGSPLTFPCLPG